MHGMCLTEEPEARWKASRARGVGGKNGPETGHEVHYRQGLLISREVNDQ